MKAKGIILLELLGYTENLRILGDLGSGAHTLGFEAGAHTGQIDLVGVSGVKSDVTTCLGGTCIYLQRYAPI